MNTVSQGLSPLQYSECAKHKQRLWRLACKLAKRCDAYNAAVAPHIPGIVETLAELNEAIRAASDFKASVDYRGVPYPAITITIPALIDYDNEVLDQAYEDLDELPRER